MKKIYLIGVGQGNPDYLTIQAINTMKQVDIFLFLEKKGKEELLKIREGILERYLDKGSYRVVVAKIPERSRSGNYEQMVALWRRESARVIEEVIKRQVQDDETAALLVWGEPSLYDGHLEMLQHILKEGRVNFEYEIIPGISSLQVLAARHKIPLNRIGEAITITTARQLKEYQSEEIKNMVVMLDSHSTFQKLKDRDIDIYWGAYLGTDDEILISGRLKDVIERIKMAQKKGRKEKGWLMDTYILRRKIEVANYTSIHDRSIIIGDRLIDKMPVLPPVVLHTDGSCKGNPGPGGWAAILISGKEEQELSGREPLTTNNRMELVAVINGLRLIKQPSYVKIYSDSSYLINAFKQNWIKNWQIKGWQTSEKQPVKNQDLWQELLQLTKPHQIEWLKVKGHSGNKYNERCDYLAVSQANSVRDRGNHFSKHGD